MQTSFKVGLFVLFISGIAAFLILTFGGRDFGKEKNFYTIYFKDVAGLSVGADVQVKGVKVGKVEKIEFSGTNIKVKVSVDKNIPIYKNAIAYIKTYGLMGDKYVYIDPGTPDTERLKNGEKILAGRIYTTETTFATAETVAEKLSITLDEINRALGGGRLEKIFKNINKLIEDVDKLVIASREDVKVSLKNIRKITEDLKENLPSIIEKMDKIAKNLEELSTENKDDIKELIANLKETSKALKEKTPEILDKLEKAADNVNDVLSENKNDLKETVVNVKDSSKELKEILSKINKGKGTIGKLVNEDELYVEATEGIKSFSKPFNILTKSRFDILMFGEKHTGNEDAKGAIGGIFYPSDNIYYYAALVANSNGKVGSKKEIKTGSSLTTEVERDYGLLVDIQYARRLAKIGNREIWFRGGMKESSAMLGLDFYYNENIRIMTDLYKIGREVSEDEPDKPQFDIGFFYKATDKPFFFRIGASDLLNDKYRGMFFGAGFMFKEDYLKYFLGAASIP